MRKYREIFRYAVRDGLVYLPSFLVQNIFFGVVVFIFFSLWRVVYAGKSLLAGLTLTQVLWYLTFTETIELSKIRIFLQIQEEIKDGSIAYALIRPYSYLLFYVYRSLGQSVVRIIPLLVEGFLLGTLFVGILPGYFKALPFGFVLILGGVLLTILWQLLIGLLAFWFEEVAPFYWILQKMVFIIGGLFFPIELFPDWLQGFAKYSPFAFSAYWPAYTMVNFNYSGFITGLLGQISYLTVLGLLCLALFHLAKRRVHVQGG